MLLLQPSCKGRVDKAQIDIVRRLLLQGLLQCLGVTFLLLRPLKMWAV